MFLIFLNFEKPAECQSVRETHWRQKERSVNRQGRRRVGLNKTC